MRRQRPVLWRVITVSAVALGTGLVVSGCSHLKMGAAAIVGSQRITIATLDTEVADLSRAAARYPGTAPQDPGQQTRQTLTWLVRFKIIEQLARQAGIDPSAATAQQALNQIYDTATSEAQASGLSNVTHEQILASNGIPPDKELEVGRFQAIEDEFVKQANGGTMPTTTSEQAAVTAKLEHAQCVAAKSLKIEINPQFGQLDYNQYLVVSAPALVSRSAGPTPAPASSPPRLTPAC